MVATDSYRLSVKETALGEAAPELEAIIPARALTELSRLSGSGDTIDLGVHENHVVFGTGDAWLTTRRIDGQFPNYRQLLPETFEVELTLPKAELADVVRRASVLALRNSPLRLRLAEGELTVSAQTQDVGETQETMPAAYSGEEFLIGFNAEFLRDGIDSIVGDDVKLKLINPLRPAILEDAAGDFTYLIMPIRLAGAVETSLIVRTVTLRDFRSYERLELTLEPGLVLVTGANGAGKTNLLESLHVGTQGFSPRTRADQQLVRIGATGPASRWPAIATAARSSLEVTLQQAGEAGEAERCAAALGRAAALRGRDARLHTRPPGRREGRPRCTPRLLRPHARRGSCRRARSCRSSTRPPSGNGTRRCGASPSESRPATPSRPGRSRSPRSARRSSSRGARRSGCSPPDSRSAPASSACRRRRSTTPASRRPPRRSRHGSTAISSAVSPASGRTSTTSRSVPASASCARFGSQGEQRLAVLSLLLAEAEVIAEQRGTPPLVLLDDVLSELDASRRRTLAERIGRVGQAIVTATGAEALPLEPAQLLEVVPGSVSVR